MRSSSLRVRDLALCGLFASLIATGAFLRIPLPLIPVTLQTLTVSLAGLLLGARRGALSAAVYVALGLLGLPIFTGGGGITYVFHPTFGYLLGFIGGAYVTGRVAHAVPAPSFRRLFFACLAGLGVVYAAGVPYLWLVSRVYLGRDVTAGAILFSGFLLPIPGDVLLSFPAAAAAKRLGPVTERL
ncbi:MAG TPA: biotin transporter BioY [Oscillospiraceae bacterium]|nr:biotin transporter BioY [Oscillospiraceae bacterium]